MDLDQEFVKLYEGWKKGKYKITDDKGNIIGTYNSGSKAQKVVDDLMQQGKYDKLTVEIIEETELGEAYWRVDIPDMPPVFIEAGSASEIKKDMRKKLKPESFKELSVERVTKSEMIKKYREMVKGGGEEEEEPKTEAKLKKKKAKDGFAFGISRKKDNKRWGSGGYRDEEIEEGYKDLPPHLQKLVKKIEKKQKDWNKKYPNAKTQTFVYNPETGKPDIEVKENMDLKDTIKKVIEDNSNDKSDDGEGLDKVQPKAVKKKFKDRKDKDIDNDGDVDSSDKFLHKKRKAISKAMSKEQKSFSKMFSHIKSLMQGK